VASQAVLSYLCSFFHPLRYILNHQPGKAVSYLLRLRKPEVFDLIKDNNLFTDVQDQALLMIEFSDELNRKNLERLQDEGSAEKDKADPMPTTRPDESSPREYSAAIDLLVQHTYSIPVNISSEALGAAVSLPN
jgi:hypothetical protein